MFILFGGIAWVLQSCSSKIVEVHRQSPEAEVQARTKAPKNSCYSWENHLPDTLRKDRNPIRKVRVSFHVLRDDSGLNNFPDEEEAKRYLIDLLNASNEKLRRNEQMHLPVGNNTPVYPIGYQYVLTPETDKVGDDGIYFHNDSEVAYFNKRGGPGNINLFSNSQFEKYGYKGGDIIPVFFIEHHPDSLKSKRYGITINGIGLHRYAKMAGAYSVWKDTIWNGNTPHIRGPWFVAGLFNHELGHSMGLAHTWAGSDGCDDTPQHRNCWGQTDNGPCKDGWSNNVMDYNGYQTALSPCQIGKIHSNFRNPRMPQRSKLVENYCRRDPLRTVHIQAYEEEVWTGVRDMEGDLVLYKDSKLTIHCDLSFPANGKIKVHPGAELNLVGAVLSSSCEGTWRGIQIMGNGNKTGTVNYYNGAVLKDVAEEKSK